MPVPRVFVSSTCYDLAPIRFDLQRLVEELGYEPLLSERGTVLFDPSKEAAASAVDDVANCDLFVLIIGGRFGTEYKAEGISVTNAEYQSAIRHSIPVFGLVQAGVMHDMRTYELNLMNSAVDAEKIAYRNADSTDIFRFVREVRSSVTNNALQEFNEFADIAKYLRNQWASLFRSYLMSRSEERRFADTLAELQNMSNKIEALSELIARKVDPAATIEVTERFDRLTSASRAARWLIANGVNLDSELPAIEELVARLPAASEIVGSPTFRSDYESLRSLNSKQRASIVELRSKQYSRTDKSLPNREQRQLARDGQKSLPAVQKENVKFVLGRRGPFVARNENEFIGALENAPDSTQFGPPEFTSLGDIRIWGKNGELEANFITDGDYIETLAPRQDVSVRTNGVLSAIAKLREKADSAPLEPNAD